MKRHKHDWYCGDQSTSEFHLRIPRSLFGDKSREKGGIPVAISSLQVVPLSLAKDCDPEYLIQRGKKVEELTRGLGLVVYTDPHQDSVSPLPSPPPNPANKPSSTASTSSISTCIPNKPPSPLKPPNGHPHPSLNTSPPTPHPPLSLNNPTPSASASAPSTAYPPLSTKTDS